MAKDDSKRVLLYHTRKEDKTIEDFVKSQKLIGITAKEVFDDNRDYIFTQIQSSPSFLEAYKEENGSVPKSGADLAETMTLPIPCQIKVCPYNITAETMINNTNWHTPNNDFYAFASEEIQKIFESPAYSALIDKTNCEVEVIGWFKQMNMFGERKHRINNVSGAWFDLSSFVISLNSNVGANGGNFTMRLPIVGMIEKLVGKTVDLVEESSGNRVYSYFKGRSLVHQPISAFYEFGNKQFYSKKSLDNAQLGNLFSSMISYNDLIFLSFAKNEEIGETESLAERVAKNSWDMIGLVDDVSVVVTGESGSGYVQITGRDLMKLLIEDGSYFFNPSSTYSAESIFANEVEGAAGKGIYKTSGDVTDVTDLAAEGRGLVKRLRNIASEIDAFAYRPMREVIYILKAVVSQLSNIEVVPGELFDFWENRTLWKDITIEEEK